MPPQGGVVIFIAKRPLTVWCGAFLFGKNLGGIELRSTVRLVFAIIMVIGIALSAASCSTENVTTNNNGIQITDQLGRKVTLNGTPQRIISIAPANTEILFALGLGDKIVGVTDYCNYPPEALAKEKVGGFSTPNIEKIIDLDPDVIFAAPKHEAEVITQLEDLGLKVIALTPATIDETYDAIVLVGSVMGVQEAASSLIENMKSEISTVTSLVANLSDEEKPNVFYIVWHDPLMTAGGDTLAGQLIELAGGKNIFDNLSDYVTVSIESVLDGEPEVIIAGTSMGSGADAPFEWAQEESRLQETEALNEGKVFSINTDLVGRFGPRIVDALYEMLRLIHPELTAQIK
jgi:iron complex transport system substrate-binding protein